MLCVLYEHSCRIFSYCIVIKKPTSIGGETQALEVSDTAFWAFSSQLLSWSWSQPELQLLKPPSIPALLFLEMPRPAVWERNLGEKVAWPV